MGVDLSISHDGAVNYIKEIKEVNAQHAPDWIYSSWLEGVSSLKVNLLGEQDQPKKYRAKLYFANLKSTNKPIEFDISIQGKKVGNTLILYPLGHKEFEDIVIEVKNIEVVNDLAVSFSPSSGSSTSKSDIVLSGIEILKE